MKTPSALARAAALLLSLPLLAAATPLRAAAEDDYREGRRAYFAGDMAGASTLLRKSADLGFAPAQALLGRVLKQTDSVDEALAYFRKSAAQGYAEAQFELGAMYAAGEGVGRDPLEARRWMARAAQAGHRSAIVVMAEAYLGGGLGLAEGERSGPAALEWIRLAAEHGHAPALDRLAAAYRNGEMGLAVDARQARSLEARAREARGRKPGAGSSRGLAR